MELTTGLIEKHFIQHELDDIVTLLKSKNVAQVAVAYGFDCEVDVNDRYVDMIVDTDALKAFIQRSEQEDKYKLGSNDLYIKAEQMDMEFLLCHESDVHLYTEDTELFDFIKTQWVGKGYKGYEKQDQDWMPIT